MRTFSGIAKVYGIVATVLVASVIGCSNNSGATASNPVPSVSSLAPASGSAGAGAQSLTVTGSSFVSSSTATFNAVTHPVTFVSATQLTIALSAADQANAGIFAVVVSNPTPGGGSSSAVSYTVNNLVPTVSGLSPASLVVGSASQPLTITGTNFVTNSTVTYNGTAHAATFVSGTQLTISLTAADLATAGSDAVVVTNPAPGGGASAATNFAVNNPVPAITTFSPASVVAGAAAQTLTINGSNFLAGSTVTYNGTAHTATFVSATSLTIPLTVADLATAGNEAVIVTNPAPGGGASAAASFPVNNVVPAVTTFSPASLTAGAAAQTLTINGTGFVSTSTVTFSGTAHTPTLVSATQLTIPLTAADLLTAGAKPVIVTNPTPGGGSSPVANFSVLNPAPTITLLAPASLSAGSAAQTLTVTGTNFIAGVTAATLAGVTVTPTIVSATTLTIPLTAANLATVATLQLVLTNPTGGVAGTAATANFAVVGVIVSGTVYKGPSVGSTVTAYEVGTNGANGLAIGTATTAAGGSFSLALTAAWAGPVRLTATGGNYVSEYDGTTIVGTSPVSALFDAVTSSVSGVAITPVSEFVNSYASGLMVKGTAEAAAHATAATLLSSYLGLSGATAIETLVPVFNSASITSNPNGFALGLYLGTLAHEGKTIVPSSPDDLISALSADISDGTWDGKTSGATIPLLNGVTPSVLMAEVKAAATAGAPGGTLLSSTAGTTDLLLSLGNYINSGVGISSNGVTVASVTPIESAIFSGITSCLCTPSAAGLAASSSGAATTYSLYGRQYLIVAARREGVVVIDITNPNLTAPPINAWPSISTTTFAGQAVGGVIAVTGLTGHPQILSYAYGSSQISVLNLTTLITGTPSGTTPSNPVDVTTKLTLTNSLVGFSGGSAYIAGGIQGYSSGSTGSTGVGVWLDTSDGYGFVPLTTFGTTPAPTTISMSPLYPVSDTSEQIAENVGADMGNNQILGGNYYGIQLIELSKGSSYFIPRSSLISTLTGFSSYDLIDGNSVDGNYRVGILTSEDTPYVGFLNLSTVTETTATPINKLAPGTGGLVQLKLGTSYSPTLSGSAVDKNSHLALFMAGYSDDFAVGKLQDPASVAAGAWTGLTDWSFYTINSSPSLASYSYATDPHSVAVVVNQSTGTPYGYLFDGGNGVVQIDMANFLTMARSGTTGDPAHQPLADPAVTKNASGGLILSEFKWKDPTSGIALTLNPADKVTQDEYPGQPMITPAH